MLSVRCSHGVAADHQMYSMLISKAGKAKDVDSALNLHQQMLDSHLQPTQVGQACGTLCVLAWGWLLQLGQHATT